VLLILALDVALLEAAILVDESGPVADVFQKCASNHKLAEI
jgi:hypothetical protein